MRISIVARAALLFCFVVPSAALAQSAGDSATAAVIASADNRSGSGLVDSGFQLHADVNGDTTAELTLSMVSDNLSSFGETAISLTFSAPINSSSKEANLITQRGLPSGFGAGLSINQIFGPDHSPQTGRELRRGALHLPIYIANLTGDIGVEDFDFRDPVSFAGQSERHTSYSLAASIGYTPGTSPIFFAAGAEYRRSWKAPDERILCPTPPPSGPVECTQGVFGPPERDVNYNLFTLVRTGNLFGLTRGQSPIALEIRATYDAHRDVFGVEVPIYFLRDADGGLRGGIRVGWDSDQDDVRVGFFIGSTFPALNL